MNSIHDLAQEINQMKGFSTRMVNDHIIVIDNEYDYFNTTFINYLIRVCPPLNLEFGFDKKNSNMQIITKF